jgi:hypothetical protein
MTETRPGIPGIMDSAPLQREPNLREQFSVILNNIADGHGFHRETRKSPKKIGKLLIEISRKNSGAFFDRITQGKTGETTMTCARSLARMLRDQNPAFQDWDGKDKVLFLQAAIEHDRAVVLERLRDLDERMRQAPEGMVNPQELEYYWEKYVPKKIKPEKTKQADNHARLYGFEKQFKKLEESTLFWQGF